MDINQTIVTISNALAKKEYSSFELCQMLHQRTTAANKILNCYISITDNNVMAEQAMLADNINASISEKLPISRGIPIAYKDIFCSKYSKTSCGSKMLDNFIAPYNATVVDKCGALSMVNMGKTNMDEFAMGISTETSYYGTALNPWSLEHVSGGSSGGSAAAVAARLVPASLGSDTGGSIRQPAAYCGICGLKPTYGRVSRHGMIAFASSLDQAGPMATTAEDCAILFDILSGHDPKDSTSINAPSITTRSQLNNDLQGKVIGVPREYFALNIHPDIAKNIEDSMTQLNKLGVTFKEISIAHHQYAIATYYIISAAECSSNLSRYDGVRYGYRAPNCNSLEEMYMQSRSEAFGDEVKRRILLGTYVLSSGYYDAYYNKAQLLRQQIQNDFMQAFMQVDAIIAPVTANPAHALGFQNETPSEKFNSDQFTVSANLAGLPALAFPNGFCRDKLPTSVQLIGPVDGEGTILNIAHIYQQHTNWHQQIPDLVKEIYNE